MFRMQSGTAIVSPAMRQCGLVKRIDRFVRGCGESDMKILAGHFCDRLWPDCELVSTPRNTVSNRFVGGEHPHIAEWRKDGIIERRRTRQVNDTERNVV